MTELSMPELSMPELSELFAEVAPDIQRAIRDLGWHDPDARPDRRDPRDARGRRPDRPGAQTGSGKTGAFGIPLVEAIDTGARRRPRRS